MDKSCTCAACGARVSSKCDTFDLNDDAIAEVFRHSTACKDGFPKSQVCFRYDNGGKGDDDIHLEVGDNVFVSWKDDAATLQDTPGTIAAVRRNGTYDVDFDPGEDSPSPPPCDGKMGCPLRSQYQGLHATETEDGDWDLFGLLKKTDWSKEGDPMDSSNVVDTFISPTEFRTCEACARCLKGETPTLHKFALLNLGLQIVPPVLVADVMVDDKIESFPYNHNLTQYWKQLVDGSTRVLPRPSLVIVTLALKLTLILTLTLTLT